MSQATANSNTNLTANPSLAERIRSYWRVLDADYNDYIVQSALRRLNGLPVVTAEDAMATLDWLIHDGHDPLADCYGSPDNP